MRAHVGVEVVPEKGGNFGEVDGVKSARPSAAAARLVAPRKKLLW